MDMFLLFTSMRVLTGRFILPNPNPAILTSQLSYSGYGAYLLPDGMIRDA